MLHFLDLLGSSLVVPEAVADEVQRKGANDPAALALESSNLTIVDALAIPAAVDAWDLGAGESAVLAYALAQPRAIALLDDMGARRCAAAVGVQFTGTAGLVLAAKRRGLIEVVEPVFRSLIDVGMYLSKPTLQQLLRKAGEL